MNIDVLGLIIIESLCSVFFVLSWDSHLLVAAGMNCRYSKE